MKRFNSYRKPNKINDNQPWHASQASEPKFSGRASEMVHKARACTAEPRFYTRASENVQMYQEDTKKSNCNILAWMSPNQCTSSLASPQAYFIGISNHRMLNGSAAKAKACKLVCRTQILEKHTKCKRRLHKQPFICIGDIDISHNHAQLYIRLTKSQK